ncbi:MAG: DUF3426 domain-containing protein [Betaproteobacteria bacterium]|nr:MAG: DUF3426 domain-containing protein [Betaproteobacteria bacterium]
MLARCPACGTTFRVQTAQLAAKGGKVRCGKCAAVFDGVSALVEREAGALEPSVPETPAAGEAAATTPEFLRPPVPPRRYAWGFWVALALLALAGQVLMHYRTEAATAWPWLRPHLAAACAVTGCELRLPRRPELLSIESSDLQSDRARDNVVVFNAVLRNRAAFAQEYPALELSLTDERDRAVLRRVLLPADYLGAAPAERAAQGLAGGAEIGVRLYLDDGGRRAVGYRLYLFFP